MLSYFLIFAFIALLVAVKLKIKASSPSTLSLTQKNLSITLPEQYQIPQVSLPKFNKSSIIYINEVTDSLINTLSTHYFLGVDIEEFRLNSYTGKICLIQISTLENTFIIDCLSANNNIKSLEVIFLDPKITKIFHGCFNDTQWLQRDFDIHCVNVFDTQLAAKYLKIGKLGLNTLWDKYCEYQMSSEYKKQMQLSDWQSRPLTQEQIEYAAMDSFYLAYLMKVMIQELDEKDIKKIRKETIKICQEKYCFKVNTEYCMNLFRDNCLDSSNLATLQVFSNTLKLLNRISTAKGIALSTLCPLSSLISLTKSKPSDVEDLKKVLINPSLAPHYEEILQAIQSSQLPDEQHSKSLAGTALRQQQKQERYKNFLKKYTISGKVFENCQIQLPNGEILCYSNQKKARWYLDRDLAIAITENPLVIRLKFEPNFKTEYEERDRRFFKKEKKNECVVCSSSQSFLRYRVIPLMYRQYFPEEYKNFCRHDVLLLCASCHEICNKHSESFKRKIAEEYSVPLNVFGPAKIFKEKLIGIRKICISLTKNSSKIPEDRRSHLIVQIQEFVEENPQYLSEYSAKAVEDVIKDLCREDNIKAILEKTENFESRCEDGDNHGRLVMEKVTDVKEFVYKWKRNFIASMQPQYLPESWIGDPLLIINK